LSSELRTEANLLSFDASRSWLERAKRTTPGGVHSNVRLAEQPFPLFITSGAAGHVTDADGNDLIDYACGNGALILGHSPAPVIEAVRRQLDRGLLYSGQTNVEVEASELLAELVPCAERVRFNVTGTEAMLSAIRIARAATGRPKILVFQGQYNGWADSVLWNVRTASSPVPEDPDLVRPVPESEGIEAAVADDVLVAQWNDAAALERILTSHGHELAAVIMEPIMSGGAVIPLPGYLEAAREGTRRHGVVLIFDEVITGFRVALGGAQVRLGVTPDVAIFGKAIAAGFPVSCVVGRADLFDGIGAGRVTHAGTFNAYPVGMAATLATLQTLADPAAGVYKRLEVAGTRLRNGMAAIARELGAGVLIQGLPMLFNVAFTDLPALLNHADVIQTDEGSLRRFLSHLITRGVRTVPRGNVYLSAAHSDEDIDRTLNAFRDALAAQVADRLAPQVAVGNDK
jgi:glutamate-1-semialdehyde 2,1-aminomutase